MLGIWILIISYEKLWEIYFDYVLVLVWYYCLEIINSEINYLEKGGKLVFDLLCFYIVNLENY